MDDRTVSAGDSSSAAGPEGRIFVYGTLRSGESAAGLLEGCERLGPAEVAGTLYDIGGKYPALVPGGAARVRGELWSVRPEVLARLDEYEGVPEGLFRRARVTVAGEPCWTYVAGRLLLPALAASAVVAGGEWGKGGG